MRENENFKLIYDTCSKAENWYAASLSELLQFYRQEYNKIMFFDIDPYYVIAINTFLISYTQSADIIYPIFRIIESYSSIKLLDEEFAKYQKINGISGSLDLIEKQMNFCSCLVGVRNARMLNIIFDNYEEFKDTVKKIKE